MDPEYRRQFTKAVWKKVCVLFDIFVSALEFGAWDWRPVGQDLALWGLIISYDFGTDVMVLLI